MSTDKTYKKQISAFCDAKRREKHTSYSRHPPIIERNHYCKVPLSITFSQQKCLRNLYTSVYSKTEPPELLV